MDEMRSCANHCIFCFVDQMPPGMRQTLYFKDDDARLSFLQGNYITLTNLTDREAQRIIDLRISPINVSVHTTDPQLHCTLTFLVVSCPCALVVSIPLGLFAGIGAASKQGILIKGGNYLEALQNIDTVVFDKTGTLTKGVFRVVKVDAQQGSKEALLQLAAYGEYHSSHPIALSIKEAYGKTIDASCLEHYEEVAGNGIQVTIHGEKVML